MLVRGDDGAWCVLGTHSSAPPGGHVTGSSEWTKGIKGANATMALVDILSRMEKHEWPLDEHDSFPGLNFVCTPGTLISGGTYESVVRIARECRRSVIMNIKLTRVTVARVRSPTMRRRSSTCAPCRTPTSRTSSPLSRRSSVTSSRYERLLLVYVRSPAYVCVWAPAGA